MYSLVDELNKEYKFRYNRKNNHKAFDIACKLPLPNIPDIGLTPFVLAMPDKYKQKNSVKAYREYYLNEKQKLFKWTKRISNG